MATFPRSCSMAAILSKSLLPLDIRLGHAAPEAPLMVNLRRIGPHPVGMHPRFLGVPQFAHLDHPQDDLPGHHGAFNGRGGIIGKVTEQQQVSRGKGRGAPVLLQGIDNLHHPHRLVGAGDQRHRQD